MLLGDSLDLACQVESQRGKMFWMRGSTNLGENEIISHFASRYSLPQFNATTRGRAEGQPANSTGRLTLNFGLRISNASLVDDANFSCHTLRLVDERRPQYGDSRRARLTVLRPPTQLHLAATSNQTQEDQSSAFFQVSKQAKCGRN